MALVYIIADAPWGPVKFGSTDHSGALIDRMGSAPARVEDIGNNDPEQVIAAARANLPAADPAGLILTSVQRAAQAIKEAVWVVLATVVATESPEAALWAGNGDLGGDPFAASDRYAPTSEVPAI